MAPKKYYAVAAGRKTGIYNNWPAAQAQVTGYPGAKFKGFPTKKEAEVWMKRPTYSQAPKKITNSPRPSITDTSPAIGEVTIYTDGGARYNPGPGGYGIVQIYNGERKELSGGYKLTTNNRMELLAAIIGLEALKKNSKVTLYSDSNNMKIWGDFVTNQDMQFLMFGKMDPVGRRTQPCIGRGRFRRW